MDYIETLEKHLGREAKKEFLLMQPEAFTRLMQMVYDLMHDLIFESMHHQTMIKNL